MKLRSRITLFQLGQFYKWPLWRCLAWAIFNDRRFLKDGKPTMKKLLILPILLLAGCATVTVPPYIGPPEQVQAEVSVLAAVAKPYIPSSDYATIHTFANALATCTSINSTILLSLVPHTGHPKTDALISAGAAFISLALSHYSSSDPVTLSYAHAVGNGLLVSFP